MSIDLRDADYPDAVSTALIEEVQHEYVIRYGGRDETPLADGEFGPPTGAFVVVRVDGDPVACGGVRRHDDDTAEIKRMYVRAAHRGTGIGRRLLTTLEQRARDLGYGQAVLETGTAQPEAMALYASAGYHPIPPYGYHRCSPRSRCFAKDL